MRKILLLLLFVLLFVSAYSQHNLSYAYDSSGNRISRTIVMSSRSADAVETSKDNTFYEEQISGMQWKIYPNPVKDQLTIQLPAYDASSKGEFALFGMSGVVMLKGKIISEITQIDMSGFTTGTYVLHIVISGERTAWKVLKQ